MKQILLVEWARTLMANGRSEVTMSGTRMFISRVLALTVYLTIFNCVLAPAARAIAPCCEITSINVTTGIVTAKVNATGQVFQFKLNDSAQLKGLKVGQAVYANMAAKQVSLDGQRSIGQIISTVLVSTSPHVSVEDERLVKDPKTRDRIIARIPKEMSAQERAAVETLVDQSLSALRAGDGATAESTIKKVKSIFVGYFHRRPSSYSGNPWESCGDFCMPALTGPGGNPGTYAFCYWLCVARGGPK